MANGTNKHRIALVGTGHRGTGMWGKELLEGWGDTVEMVGICDTNPGNVDEVNVEARGPRRNAVSRPRRPRARAHFFVALNGAPDTVPEIVFPCTCRVPSPPLARL